MCYSLCLLAPPSEIQMKAAVTSYVVCVVSNMEFSEHYFSAKRAKIYAPTVEYTDKKEIQNGAVAKSYMTNALLIYD